jgi:hypothetical protein
MLAHCLFQASTGANDSHHASDDIDTGVVLPSGNISAWGAIDEHHTANALGLNKEGRAPRDDVFEMPPGEFRNNHRPTESLLPLFDRATALVARSIQPQRHAASFFPQPLHVIKRALGPEQHRHILQKSTLTHDKHETPDPESEAAPFGPHDAAGRFPNPLAPHLGSIVAVLAACRAHRLALVCDKSPFRVASILEMNIHHVELESGQVLVVDLVQLDPEHSHYCHV